MEPVHVIELTIASFTYFLIYFKIRALSSQISKLQVDISDLKKRPSQKDEDLEVDLNDRLSRLQRMKFSPRFITRVK